ncbi:MAG: LysM peptidoglycan-binding domain-containing protein [Candidatus Binataceae bacterium]
MLRRINSILYAIAIVAAIATVPAAAGAQSGLSETTIPASPPVAQSASASDESSNAAASSAVVAVPVREAAEHRSAPDAVAPPHPAEMIPYTVRPGDSIGAIAQMFGVEAGAIRRVNRIGADDELMAGQVLRVPNPFAAQVSSLESQLSVADSQLSAANQKADSAAERAETLQSQARDLKADNKELRSASGLVLWWRATAASAGVAALLMFGVMGVTLFEWWRMRRKFVALAAMTESLGHLDYKYKAMLAKAELRLQQIYGRRRAGFTEGQPRSKMPEEIEIERLNEELKEVLETHLERLGARPHGGARRRRSWREMLTGGASSSTAAARAARR